MEEHQERAPATNARVKAHEGEASAQLETTDVLTRRVRDEEDPLFLQVKEAEV